MEWQSMVSVIIVLQTISIQSGMSVYAQDHRGHGLSATDDDLGWFSKKHGWARVVQDTVEISEMIKKRVSPM